jgi:tetratricopeptide (TPR) repeat protein
MKRYGEALANYDQALAIKPDYANAKANRDALLREQKQAAEARAVAAVVPAKMSEAVPPKPAPAAPKPVAIAAAKKFDTSPKAAKSSRSKGKGRPPKRGK